MRRYPRAYLSHTPLLEAPVTVSRSSIDLGCATFALVFAVFALAVSLGLGGCAPASPCDAFVNAWNACSASSEGNISSDACSGEDDSALSCAADALYSADCSTEEGRAAGVSAALACGIHVSGSSDTGGGNDTGGGYYYGY